MGSPSNCEQYELDNLNAEESDDEYAEYTQPNDADNDDDNDEDMEEENVSNKNKKSSDKEEMDEDEEKQIVEVIQCTKKRVLIEEAMRGNQCDWIHSLYVKYENIPSKVRKTKVHEIKKPHHTPSKSPKRKKKINQSPNRAQIESTEEQKEVPSFSQSSWKSQDILLCDKAVEEHQKKQRANSEDVALPAFIPPKYSITERMKNNKCNAADESIISVQESVVNESNITTNEQQMNVDDDNEEDEQGMDDMDEYVDREYLGELTRSDLERMHRYFIKVGAILNANNNNDPNNPFNV